VRIEREAARQIVGDGLEPLLQPFEPRLVPVEQVDRLDVGQNRVSAERLTDDRKDHLAERARLRHLDEAPFGGKPARREHQRDRVAAGDLLVEPLLPILAGGDAAGLVDVEENPLESELRQLGLDVIGGFLIEARMTDKDGGHVSIK
jgi:hypothetical protein